MARPGIKKAMAEAKAALARRQPDYATIILDEAHRRAPQDAGIAGLLADIQAAQGCFMEAVEVLAGHLQTNAGSTGAAQRLSDLFSAVTPVTFATVSASGLAAALSLDRVTPEPLARAAGLLLMERGGLAGLSDDEALAGLLKAMLQAAPVTEPTLEAQLVGLRKAIILGENTSVPDDLLPPLAHQAWLNEYVWPVSDDERAAIRSLASTTGDDAAALVLALYQPPGRGIGGSLKALARVIDREAHDMARADSHLAAGSGPVDETGRAVAGQYEENPYPRWRWMQSPSPGAARRLLVEMTSDAPVDLKGGWDRGQLRILIAGCGTGQQAVRAAQAYAPRADLLAFDFSRASLRYASMRARQHRVGNLRFRQADVMALPEFDAPFDGPVDLLECVGVLHHLADPFAGWRVLLDRLKPGGLMYLGIYSATARHELTRYRETLAAKGMDGSNADAMRDIRSKILADPADDFEKSLSLSADFHTLSNLRDLLFHTHEKPVTLEHIRNFREDEELDLLRMDVRSDVADAFAAEEGRGALNDLRAWERFEVRHPKAFEGMYLFWIQKPV